MTTATGTDRDSAGWTADASTFGARLALVRQHMRWGNVERAARACRVPVETWRSWERDGREPHRRDTVAKLIATATGCDFLWLVHGPDRGGASSDKSAWLGERLLDRSRHTRPVRQTRPVTRMEPLHPQALSLI